MLKVLFWSAAGLFLYTHCLYPLLLMALPTRRRLVPADPQAGIAPQTDAALPHTGAVPPQIGAALPQTGAALPQVAVVLSAFNEERHIAPRVNNLLQQDYPPDRLAIYVGSDGSDDQTLAQLERFASDRIYVYPFAERRGKATVLNDLMRQVTAPITIMTDANVTFDDDAVALLVRALGPTVGAVCGELTLKATAADNQDSAYWRLERLLKQAEANIGGLLGANGAIYAIRTECFEPLRADTLIDDFVITMRIAAQGKQLVYEPAARAREDSPETIEDEFRRRVRIGLGNFQTFFRYPEFLVQTSLIRSFTYLSHKVLRWFGPHLLLVALVASGLLAGSNFYATIFALQLALYAALAGAHFARKRVRLPAALLAALLFASMNLAFAVAFARYCSRDLGGQWSRTPRRSTARDP